MKTGQAKLAGSNPKGVTFLDPTHDTFAVPQPNVLSLRPVHEALMHTNVLYLHQAAGLLHMSPKTFSRFFKRAMQMTFRQATLRYRLEKGGVLLCKTPPLSIQRISEIVGYADLLIFERAFKKQTGMSPSAYRKKTCATVRARLSTAPSQQPEENGTIQQQVGSNIDRQKQDRRYGVAVNAGGSNQESR
jgi:AraC-like DNA-binding protein